jgi:hypothetical protein
MRQNMRETDVGDGRRLIEENGIGRSAALTLNIFGWGRIMTMIMKQWNIKLLIHKRTFITDICQNIAVRLILLHWNKKSPMPANVA